MKSHWKWGGKSGKYSVHPMWAEEFPWSQRIGQPWNVSTSGGVPETLKPVQSLNGSNPSLLDASKVDKNYQRGAVYAWFGRLLWCFPLFSRSETSYATSTIFHQQLCCYSWVARVVPPSTDSDRCSSHPPICGPSTPCSWSATPELLAVAAWPAKKLLSSFRTSKSQVKYYQLTSAYFFEMWSCGNS